MFYIFSYMSIYFLEREMKIKGSYILPIVHTHTLTCSIVKVF